MSLTKPTLDMIDGGRASGEVVSTGKGLSVSSVSNDIADAFGGTFDNTTGNLILSVPGYPVLKINGFMTQSDIGTGREGAQGQGGTPGIDGIIGEHGLQGQRGCQGPQGPGGERGVRGPQGKQGEQGSQGSEGEEGIPGLDGRVSIFINQEDPGPVGPGALWIKPN